MYNKCIYLMVLDFPSVLSADRSALLSRWYNAPLLFSSISPIQLNVSFTAELLLSVMVPAAQRVTTTVKNFTMSRTSCSSALVEGATVRNLIITKHTCTNDIRALFPLSCARARPRTCFKVPAHSSSAPAHPPQHSDFFKKQNG